MTTAMNGPGSIDPGLEALATLLHFQGVAADREQIRHRLGVSAIGASEMIRCARDLGLKARTHRTTWPRLAGTPLPAIASLRDGSFVVVGKASDDQVLVLSSQTARPTLMTRDEFSAAWDGGLMLMTRRAGLTDLTRRFDHHLVPRRDAQIPASAGRGAGGLVLPAAVRPGLAAVLPGGDRQGAGASRA